MFDEMNSLLVYILFMLYYLLGKAK
jgi:hypothetical protein